MTSKKLEWVEEPAKGGGRDFVAGQFVIQDNFDKGGWRLYVGPTMSATLDEAKAIAQRLQDVLDGEPELTREKLDACQRSAFRSLADTTMTHEEQMAAWLGMKRLVDALIAEGHVK
jgi:hypothetical protein